MSNKSLPYHTANHASFIHDAMCHVIHIYRRISVVPYQSVIPNSHQVPCNGFMLVAASQPAMQPNTDTHYQSLSVRSPYSSHAIVSSAEMST